MEDDRWFLASQAHLAQALAEAGVGPADDADGMSGPFGGGRCDRWAPLPDDEVARIEVTAQLINEWICEFRRATGGRSVVRWRVPPELSVEDIFCEGRFVRLYGRAILSAPAP
jgi:hypothetical protein